MTVFLIQEVPLKQMVFQTDSTFLNVARAAPTRQSAKRCDMGYVVAFLAGGVSSIVGVGLYLLYRLNRAMVRRRPAT
jgi:hypothetical protein